MVVLLNDMWKFLLRIQPALIHAIKFVSYKKKEEEEIAPGSFYDFYRDVDIFVCEISHI